jgi:hypothetical protein
LADRGVLVVIAKERSVADVVVIEGQAVLVLDADAVPDREALRQFIGGHQLRLAYTLNALIQGAWILVVAAFCWPVMERISDTLAINTVGGCAGISVVTTLFRTAYDLYFKGIAALRANLGDFWDVLSLRLVHTIEAACFKAAVVRNYIQACGIRQDCSVRSRRKSPDLDAGCGANRRAREEKQQLGLTIHDNLLEIQ